ncbi:MAG: beta strand repeat-containing protein, partial [Sumerlaeia bacterium]
MIFGNKEGNTVVDLSNLGDGGFRIFGADENDTAGWSVSGAGDVNGDGFDDLIIGSIGANKIGPEGTGVAYVVFGKNDATTVDLFSLGTKGFEIRGEGTGNETGYSVSGAGDVNGDGLADLIVGSPEFSEGRNGRGYVIFGKTSTSVVRLSNLGTNGFFIDGISDGDFVGRSVSGAGGVNGDGLADIVIGAPGVDLPLSRSAGQCYVVFGKTNTTGVFLSNLGTAGFTIDGANALDALGRSASGAGDVNGDGLADLIIGASAADPSGNQYAGSSYVIFGKKNTTPIMLSSLGSAGFQINGANTDDSSGRSVSGAGDVNGDGFADLLIGARGAAVNGKTNAGVSYLVYGKTNNTTINLSSLGTAGFTISGTDEGDFSGASVSGAGDVNRDGLGDIIIGARRADPGNLPYAGESYVLFSQATAPASATYRAVAKAGDAPRQSIGITGDGSNDSTPDSRMFIDFADGGNISTQIVTLFRNNTAITGLTNTANVMWQAASTRNSWTSAEVTFQYTDAEIAGLNEANLVLVQASNPAGPWRRVTGSSVDVNRNQISGLVGRLGNFALTDSPPPANQTIALSALGTTFPGFVINGASLDDNSGFSVSGAGDVNGDGLADVIVGARNAMANGSPASGKSYVVFGKPNGAVVNLSNLESGGNTEGFVINGIDTVDRSGTSVSGVGDINGDGLADLLVGAPGGAKPGMLYIGECSVVFGKATTSPVELSNLGTGGFRIEGVAALDQLGISVSGAGDVNGDGFDDLIVGAFTADIGRETNAGESYVVFGKATNTTVTLSNLGNGGFRIEGALLNDLSGRSVSGAGDVNGDGLSDVIIGAYKANLNGVSKGESYVVFGKTTTTPVSLDDLGTDGIKFQGTTSFDESGSSVSAAGDVNGDGFADLIIGTPGANGSSTNAGVSYVVFGGPTLTSMNLSDLGFGGFRILGVGTSDYSGMSVASAGDVNGDGLADLLVGASSANPSLIQNAGISYVVYGKTNSSSVDLGNLGEGGFQIDGKAVNNLSGNSVSGA